MASHSLFLPKIIMIVLSFVKNYKNSLCYATSVHPTWAQYDVPLLQRKVALKKLLDVNDSDQRQLYASLIQKLSVSVFSICTVNVSYTLTLPQLWELIVNANYSQWDLKRDELTKVTLRVSVDHVKALSDAMLWLATGLQYSPLTHIILSIASQHAH